MATRTIVKLAHQQSPPEGQQQQQPTSVSSGASSRRSSNASTSAGCDIESIGPNGEVTWRRLTRKFNPYTEFPEFGRRGVGRLREAFEEFDADKDGHLGLEDLKLMMERLGAPQTHLGLKALLREFDACDGCGGGGASRIDFRGFLALFRKAAAGQLDAADSLLAWYSEYVGVDEVSVGEVGVRGAKDFFEAKIALAGAGDRVQAEIREEQRLRQAEEDAKRARQESFKAKRDLFK